MNDKVNYSDVNRFLVSLGLLLIFVALGLPFLLLKNNYEVIIEQNKFDSLTYYAQSMIITKQNVIQILVVVIPTFSVVFLIFGIISINKGIRQWLRRQTIEDEKFDAEKSKVKAEISRINAETLKINLDAKSLTDQQLNQKNLKEIELENKDYSEKEKDLLAAQYLLIEKLIYEKLQFAFYKNYNLLSNQIINNYEFDLILNPKNSSSRIQLLKEIIVEIKFLNKYNGRVINSAIEHTRLLAKNYPNKIPKAYLILICSSNEVKENSLTRVTAIASDDKKGSKISIKLFTISELLGLKPENIIN